MRGLYLAAVLLLSIINHSWGQGNAEKGVWFNLGIGGEFGNSNMMNTNLSDDENISIEKFNNSSALHARTGITLNQAFNISVEGQLSSYTQKYDIEQFNRYDYAKHITVETLEAGLFFRYINVYGIYLEGGPKFSLMQEVNAEFVGNSPDGLQNDQTERYKDYSLSAMGGIGLAFYGTKNDRFRVNLGVRAYYGIGNIMEANDYPVFDAEGYGFSGNSEIYEENHPTRIVSFRLKLDLNYYFGFMGQSPCGQRRIRFFP